MITPEQRRRETVEYLRSLNDKTFMGVLSENLFARIVVAGDDGLYERMIQLDLRQTAEKLQHKESTL